GVVGSFRGGHQIAYAAAKVPIAILATLCLAAPAFHAIAAVLGRPWPMRSIISLALAAAGRSSLVLLAFAPALWLVYDFGMGYHTAALFASAAYAIAGLAALSVLVRGLGAGPGRITTAVAFMAVFFMVGGQTAWILRPYLVRPRTTSIPFLRDREGSFVESVLTSLSSANGRYSVNSYERERTYDERRELEPEIEEENEMETRRVRSIDEAP
ncbi:MAG TPA: hypothetical protein PK156_41595, partial [Polyangium sp.]|nr:hypothetical protein [Polyangium sp.]